MLGALRRRAAATSPGQALARSLLIAAVLGAALGVALGTHLYRTDSGARLACDGALAHLDGQPVGSMSPPAGCTRVVLLPLTGTVSSQAPVTVVYGAAGAVVLMFGAALLSPPSRHS
jgi:hypothetical protein